MPVVGEFGAVGWTTQLPDLAALEASQATLRASDEWLKLADRSGNAYRRCHHLAHASPQLTARRLRGAGSPAPSLRGVIAHEHRDGGHDRVRSVQEACLERER